MNIYDFDKTIYDGDSSINFFKYSLKTNKKCYLVFPKIVLMMCLYLIKIIEKEQLKSSFFSIVKYFDDIDNHVLNFWECKKYNLKNFYLKQKKQNDIVISASPEFLLRPVAKKYGFKLIATKVDKKNGKCLGKNCYGKEKVVRLKKEMKIEKCNNFYSDSLSDAPLSYLSKKSFIVKGDRIIEWENYEETFIKKTTRLFFNRDFVTFIAIGIISVFNGMWIAYFYSLFIKNKMIVYMLVFFTSLCISYLLNTTLNFKQKFSLKKFYKFMLNNIPNFLIQIFCIVVVIKVFGLPKLISYAITAVIAVPITYLLVRINVFKN